MIYLELNFIISYRAGAHARFADSDHIRSVKLGPMALFNKYIILICSIG